MAIATRKRPLQTTCIFIAWTPAKRAPKFPQISRRGLIFALLICSISRSGPSSLDLITFTTRVSYLGLRTVTVAKVVEQLPSGAAQLV